MIVSFQNFNFECNEAHAVQINCYQYFSLLVLLKLWSFEGQMVLVEILAEIKMSSVAVSARQSVSYVDSKLLLITDELIKIRESY